MSDIQSDIDFVNNGANTAPTNDVPGTANPAPADNALDTEATEETPASGEAEQPEKGKPDPNVQKAIDRQRRLRGEAERRAARAEGELAAYRQMGAVPQPAATPKASGSEIKASDFATYDDFILAKAEQRAEAKMEEKLKGLRGQSAEQAAEAAEKQQRDAFLREGATQAKAAGIDFEDAWDTLRAAPTVSPTVAQFLYDADHKALLASHLAENPDELARLSELHPLAAVKALTKLEARLGAKPSSRTTNAPPPPPRVGGSSSALADPNKMSTAELAKYLEANS